MTDLEFFFFHEKPGKKNPKINRAYRSKVALYQSCQCKKKIRGKEKVHKNLYVKVDKSTQKKTDIRSIVKALELMSTILLSGFT